jgi:hypothetical protein
MDDGHAAIPAMGNEATIGSALVNGALTFGTEPSASRPKVFAQTA